MCCLHVFIKEVEASLAVAFHQKTWQFVTAAEKVVEMVIAKADNGVVFDSATIIDAFDVGPQAGA